MKMLDLFSGIGGMSLAAEWAGIETVAFCEIEPYCQQVLKKHWPDVPIYNDVRELTRERLEQDGVIGDGRTIDLICGGYPCQPFSIAGKRRGAEDDRHLWPEMFRLVRELRPTWVVGENVAGHVSLGLDDVLSDLESEGYTCRAFVVPAAAVGAPHRRDRVFVVAYTENRQQQELSTGDHRREEWWETQKRYGTGASGGSECRGSSEGIEFTRTITASISENVANAKDEWVMRRNGELPNDEESGGSGCHHNGRTQKNDGRKWRAVEPGLGGVLDGLSDWLDGCRWPAPLGQPQYDWEPPRVATGIKNRTHRLKALGNAVVPQQVYPIFEAIKRVHLMNIT